MLYICIVLSLSCVALGIEVLRLRDENTELRWIHEKIAPLMIQIASEDLKDGDYLDPESLMAYTRGEITVDQVVTVGQALKKAFPTQ